MKNKKYISITPVSTLNLIFHVKTKYNAKLKDIKIHAFEIGLENTSLFVLVDGLFSDWSDWYNCDSTCGGGIQWRNRSCIGTAFGGMPCKGEYNDSQACNEFNCPSKSKRFLL